MAGKVKFPLKMADGAVVRDPEELKEHFDLASVLGYYDDGRLTVWLENCYCDKEARQVRALDSSDPDFKRKLCEILGIQSADVAEMDNPFTSITRMVNAVSMSEVREDNRRLNELRQHTDDDTILGAVDRVAFTQEEMLRQVRAGWKEIYLYGELFYIPAEAQNVTFIGINKPKVRLLDRLAWKGLQFRNVDFLVTELIQQADATDDPAFSVSLLLLAAESGDAEAQYKLALRYADKKSVISSPADAFKWMQKAAQQGYTDAQRKLGHFYYKGYATEKNYELAAQWYQRAADGGDLDAQNMIGVFYGLGIGVPQSYEAAIKWYRKAAEQGYGWAQYNLGRCYQKGRGIDRDEKDAIKWLQKASDGGITRARRKLLELTPKQFKLSEVVLCAAGGKDNIDSAQLDVSTYTIGIAVKDREKVDEAVLKRYGTTEIQITPIYRERTEKKISPQKALGAAARAYFGLWAYDVGKAVFQGKPLLDVWTNKAVNEDLGWGFLRFRLKMITVAMAEDFNQNVKKDPDTP